MSARELYRHTKSGCIYEAICNATIEKTGALAVVYRNIETGESWVRPAVEFYDGRFDRTESTIEGKAMKRPTVTNEIVREAAEYVLRAADDDEIEAVVKIYNHPMDGYRIARALEDELIENYTTNDVLEFDGISSRVDNSLREKEWQWVKEWNIQPPLPAGTAIKQGIIHDVCIYRPATYRVAEYRSTSPDGFLLVKFENAVAV
jgi:hypothetical protein